MQNIYCPWCDSENSRAVALLGSLGSCTHYRCRYCGGQWSRVKKVKAWPSSSQRAAAGLAKGGAKK